MIQLIVTILLLCFVCLCYAVFNYWIRVGCLTSHRCCLVVRVGEGFRSRTRVSLSMKTLKIYKTVKNIYLCWKYQMLKYCLNFIEFDIQILSLTCWLFKRYSPIFSVILWIWIVIVLPLVVKIVDPCYLENCTKICQVSMVWPLFSDWHT